MLEHQKFLKMLIIQKIFYINFEHILKSVL